MSNITIYHNPSCGTSRNTLKLIEHLGYTPTVIYYLDTPPSKEVLTDLLKQMDISAFELLRKNVPEYALLISPETISDALLISHMVLTPILINRPIVIGDLGVALCRPSERVLEILKHPLTDDFTKEDGEIIPAEQV